MIENSMLRILITLLSAFSVGIVLRRLKIPGGMMLGGIVGAATLNILTTNAYAPHWLLFISQTIAGGFLGASLKRDDVKKLPRLIVPLVIIISGMTISNILIGFLISKVSPLDAITSLASGIAGGINDIPLIAAEIGANASMVAALQFVRLLTGIGILPVLIRIIDKSEKSVTNSITTVAKQARIWKPSDAIITLAATTLGGMVGNCIGIPAGTLLFAMIFSAALQLSTDRAFIPPITKPVAQLLTGTYIGCLFEKSDLLQLKHLVLPALIIMFVFTLNCFVSSYLIRRTSWFNKRESMLATTPAGASEIALISSDMNVELSEATDIMLLHVVRVITSVSIMPQIIPYIAKFF